MSNIRPYIIINGKNSNEINGLIISSLPPISKPPMRATSEEIDGRDGDIITKLGFSAYDKTIQIGLAGSYDVNDVISYFNQEGIIIFSNEPDKYYRFTQLNGIDFEKLIRFKTASVVFHCQPFKYSNTENPLLFLEPRTVSVTNSGNTFSKPELAITGKGNVDMLINNKPVLSLDLGESQQTLIIDAEKMNTYGARSNIKKLDVGIKPKQNLNGYESVWLSPLNQMPYQSRINTNTGNLALEKLVGLTVCFNQLVNTGDTSINTVSGHKYYTSINGTKSIIQGGSAVSINDSSEDNVIDLTAMFGSEVADYLYTLESGTAGAGVSIFKSLFGADYYPYTANVLKSSKPTGKKIVGFNQWDEQWELGSFSWSTGVPFADNTRIRSTNYITVFPNTNYFNSNSGYAVDCYFYDESHNFISPLYRGAGNQTITTPSNCKYMKFCMYATYGTTYNHDICINISDNAKNGTYEPYSEITIVYSGNELRGLLKVVDGKLVADGDIDDGSGSTDIRYEERAYQSGDESLANAITDGTNTVVKLATPTTATSTAWTNPIQAKQGGTETFVDTRTIALPTGHDTIYGNICDIEGWDDCTVSRNGVNQWDEITETGSIDSSTGANASDSSMLRSKNYIEVKAGNSYYCHTNNHNIYIYGYDNQKAFVSAIGTGTKDASITIPNGVEYIRFVIESSYGTTYNHDISINYPATKTDYNEFEGIFNTFEFDNTVFGGVLDVSTGVLKLTCVLNTLGAFNYTYSEGYFKTFDLISVLKTPIDDDSKIESVCEALVYRTWNELANYGNSYAFDSSTGELRIKCSEITDASSFKSLMRNIHILYEVVNPVEIQLTAWEILSLIGENNIFASTGAISSCIYEKDGADHEASGDIITFTINAHDIISDSLKNRLVTGNYENVRLKVGANTITFVGLPDLEQNIGEVDELSVSNYSRWL